jgi:hypothetical protein
MLLVPYADKNSSCIGQVIYDLFLKDHICPLIASPFPQLKEVASIKEIVPDLLSSGTLDFELIYCDIGICNIVYSWSRKRLL